MTNHWTRLIERYLNDELSSEMKLDFENELAQNTDLQAELEFHKDIQGAFQRNSDRSIILSTQKRYAQQILFKKIGFVSLFVLTAVLTIWLIAKLKNPQIESELNTENRTTNTKEINNVKIDSVISGSLSDTISNEVYQLDFNCVQVNLEEIQNTINTSIPRDFNILKNAPKFSNFGIIGPIDTLVSAESDLAIPTKGFSIKMPENAIYSRRKHRFHFWKKLFGLYKSPENIDNFEAKMIVRGEKIVLLYSQDFSSSKKYEFSFVTHTEKGEYHGNSWILKEDKRVLANKSIRYEQEIPFEINLNASYISVSIYEIKKNKRILLSTRNVRITQ